MDRFIRAVDGIAAAFMFFVAFFTLVAVIGRKFVDWSPPDYFDLARLALGIAIFWGIASACYRNGHILVDILYEAVGPRWKRRLDLAATAILALFMAGLAVMTADAVNGARTGNVQTAELHLPMWVFYAVASAGGAAGFVLTCVRLVRLVRGEPAAALR
ncbi:MAG TPA: TRAP transporter small permease [Burkholderiales bacterium]|nr:TRAP transporter small permease [Burkholderiales bacterium]